MTSKKLRELYPEREPFQTHRLERPGGHRLYLEECGNRHGIPIIFLHGGPGSGCNTSHRRYFNPQIYRIILFDQRGAGLSLPHGHLEMNTTHDLVGDMEAIRLHLGIETWALFAGSWGAALALIYAQSYPQRVTGMILRGSFLARQRDMQWFTEQGVVNIFPDDWQKFIDHFMPVEQMDIIAACYRAVFSPDKKRRYLAARAWSHWTDRVVCHNLVVADQKSEAETKQKDDNSPSQEQMDYLVRKVALEMHYAYHRYFIADNQILHHMGKLPPVPVMLIHGRKDLTCPVESSWLLHRAIPQSSLRILPDTGHLLGEPGMIDAALDATDEMAVLLAG